MRNAHPTMGDGKHGKETSPWNSEDGGFEDGFPLKHVLCAFSGFDVGFQVPLMMGTLGSPQKEGAQGTRKRSFETLSGVE